MVITLDDIQKQTEIDTNMKNLKHYIRYGWPTSDENQNLSIYKKYADRMSMVKGCILFDNRVLIPDALRNEILIQFHEDHPGVVAMKSIVRSLIWYPGIDKDVEELVKNCTQCQSNRSLTPQKNYIEWPIPKSVWSRVHIDHFFYEGKICLVAVDALSKYIECEVVRSTSTEDTIKALRIMFSHQGLCNLIISDNASVFLSADFKDFLDSCKIRHKTPPPASPSSNGQAERSVKVIKDLLKKCDKSLDFQSKLSKVLLYYRSVPHSITKISPCVALNKRKYLTLKDKVNPLYNCEEDCGPSKTIQVYEVGDRVLALNLREGPKWYHGKILQKLGVNVYNVRIDELNIVWKRHTNQLLKSIQVPMSQNQMPMIQIPMYEIPTSQILLKIILV